jgi:hypothetical protein
LLGVTVVAKPRKLVTRNITLSGKGTLNFGDVAAGAKDVASECPPKAIHNSQ